MEQPAMPLYHDWAVFCTCSRAYLFPYLEIYWMHHAEIWFVIPIDYALYTISRGYLHVHKCSCTSFQANLLASASPKRRLLGYSSINFTSVNHRLLYTSFDILLTSRVLCLTGLSYLCQRPQWVIPNGKPSGWTPLLPSVPEGNILGPLLFACYVADLNNIKTGCLSYADVKIFRRIRKHADTISL